MIKKKVDRYKPVMLVVFIFGISLLAVIGFLSFQKLKKQNITLPSTFPTSINSIEAISEENINRLVESGKSFICTWTDPTGGFNGDITQQGRTYIKNNNLYSEITSHIENDTVIQYILYDDSHRYSWFSVDSQNFIGNRKSNIATQQKYGQDMLGRFDGDSYTYSCNQVKDSEINNALFKKPQNIPFEELEINF